MKNMTLGQLIESLQKIENKEKFVFFDFCCFSPGNFGSYRGYYTDLYLDYHKINIKVGDLLLKSIMQVDNHHTGYKGGDFMMTLETPIWIDEYGVCTETMLTGVKDDGVHIILTTEKYFDEK